MTRSVTFFRYVAWENIDRFLAFGWRVVGSMGPHRDEYGLLMARDDDNTDATSLSSEQRRASQCST
jgi:hypothetical protein